VVKWLILLLHIREVPGSNLGPETDYPDGFRGFFSPSRRMPGCILKVGHNSLLPKPFQFMVHLSPVHSTLFSLSCWKSKSKFHLSYGDKHHQAPVGTFLLVERMLRAVGLSKQLLPARISIKNIKSMFCVWGYEFLICKSATRPATAQQRTFCNRT
jgi:hypothetical protein